MKAPHPNHWTARELPDKLDFQIRTVKIHKKGQYIMIKGSIQEEDITIVNIYAPDIGAPQYIRKMLTAMKGKSTVTQS